MPVSTGGPDQALLVQVLHGAPLRVDVAERLVDEVKVEVVHLRPAFIDVGSAETFRDEDVSYASQIWQAARASRSPSS